MELISAFRVASRERAKYDAPAGYITAARIPMIVMTIIISMRVKARKKEK
jgi:hypothetical protein